MALRSLTPELAEYARVTLNEDPKKLVDGIKHLKDWIAKQPHLRARTDDQWLAAFLRGCKFSSERAKEKIDTFYSLRSIAPELNCLKFNDPKFMEILKSGIFLVLPKTAGPIGSRVIMLRHRFFDPKKNTPYEVFTVLLIIRIIMFVEDDNAIVSGVQHISDCEGTSFSLYATITPVMLRQMLVALREAVPLRQKGSYILNTHPALEKMVKFPMNFLSEKIKNRIHMYGKNFDDIYEHVPKDVLPVEYGGTGGTVTEIIDNWVNKIQEYRAWLEEDEQFGTNEALRPGNPKTAKDMFGVEGSFRQLDFD